MRRSFFSLLMALATTVVLIILGTENRGQALAAFFLAPLTNNYYLGSMISQASLLLLTGSGVCIAFSAGTFNLGGDGQAYAGGLSAALVFLLFQAVPGAGIAPVFLVIILALLGSLGASSLQGFLAGTLRNRLQIDPMISSFLVAAALVPFMDSLIIGPLRDGGGNLLAMPELESAFQIPHLSSNPRLHGGIIISLIIWSGTILWYSQSRQGFELKITGANSEFAEFLGVDVGTVARNALVVSAALHGIAGYLALVAVQHAAVIGFTAGLGWNGIAVSLVARNKLENMPFAALVFAYLSTGAKAAMIYTSFSFELSTIIQAVVFLLISVQYRSTLFTFLRPK